MISNTEILTHRTSLTAADSGDTPSAWADTPSAFSMAGSDILRIFPSYTGTITNMKLQIFTMDGSTVHKSEELEITSDFTETIDFKDGYQGESIYIKVTGLTGTTPVLTLKVKGVNI